MADATKIIHIEDTAKLDTLQAGYRKVENELLLLKQDLVDITAAHYGWEGKMQKRCQVFAVFFCGVYCV